MADGESRGAHWYEDRGARVPLCVETELGSLEISYVDVRITYDHLIRSVGRRGGELLCTATLRRGQRAWLRHHVACTNVVGSREPVAIAFMQRLAQVHAAAPGGRSLPVDPVLTRAMAADRSLGSSAGSDGGESELRPRPSLSCRTAAQAFERSAHEAAARILAEREHVVWIDDGELERGHEIAVSNDHDVAVQCFVRRVVEQYAITTRVCEVSVRCAQSVFAGRTTPQEPWRELDDLRALPEDVRERLVALRPRLPRVGEEVESSRAFCLPTDEIAIELEPVRANAIAPERLAANDGRGSQWRAHGVER